MKPKVYVSTGMFTSTPMEAVQFLRAGGIEHIELSGCSFVSDPIAGLADAASAGPLQVHNYFPPQRNPFVFNLCDPDREGRERSLRLAFDAIDLGKDLGSDVYSFHAGFLGTPAVSDLGRTWGVTNRVSLDQGVSLFAESVLRVADYAEAREVSLLVENNVLTSGTARNNGDDILLMTTPQGMRDVLETVGRGVRLLMDVAHLNVSAQTLGFDAAAALAEVTDLVGGYHLSDNDGLVDSNDPISPESWFWSGLTSAVSFVTLEIRPEPGVSMADQVKLAERSMSADVAG